MSIQIYDRNGQPYEADLVDGDEYRQVERENAALRATLKGQAKYHRDLRADRDRLDWLQTTDGGNWAYEQLATQLNLTRAAIDAAREEQK